MAGNFTDEEVREKLVKSLKRKVDRVKAAIEEEDGSQEKLDRFITENNLQEVLAKTMYVPAPKEIKYMPKIINEMNASQAQFNKRLSQNYYDDALRENRPETPNKLVVGIQREIAELSKKMILLSQEHQHALNQYLYICENN